MVKYEDRNFAASERKHCDELLKLLEQELSWIRAKIVDNESTYLINRALVTTVQHTDTILGAISDINTARITCKKEDDDR